MITLLRPAALILAPTLAVASLAQAQAEVVGLTHKSPLLVRQVMDGQTCQTQPCQVLLHQARVAATAGGTAYDARQGAVWISNGTMLDVQRPPGGLSRACTLVCPQRLAPLPPNSNAKVVTGMCFLEAGTLNPAGQPGPTGRIYFTYDVPMIGWADTRGCTLSNFKSCTATSISTNFPIGGLACDDLTRTLFVGLNHSSAGAMIYAFDADNPCTAKCRTTITVDRSVCASASPLRGITGLAYDSCSQLLYVTDGLQTVYGTFAFAGGRCTWTHRGCCKPPAEEYTGLAMLPPAQASLGQTCTVAACNACPVMRAQTTGEPVMGNASFSLDLVNAPSNYSTAALAIGLGSCAAPGVNLGFCTNVLVAFNAPGPLVFFYSPPSTPPPTCNGVLRQPLTIPVSQNLCNFKLSFQWLVACQGTPPGNGLTNCQSLTVSGI